MERYDDWPVRLEAAVRARMDAPFSYGRHDCCLAAADIINAMTGTDPMAGFRGRYKSAAGAARLLKTDGQGTLLKTLISLMPRLGARRIQPRQARRGDLVVTDEALHDACRGQACGISIGYLSVFPGETGWTTRPTAQSRAVFQIGG